MPLTRHSVSQTNVNPQPDELHDALIVSASAGPRREVSFELTIFVKGEGSKLQPRAAKLRFGAIENFDAVGEFVRMLPVPPSDNFYVDEIDSLKKGPKGWTLVLDDAGPCEIRSPKTPDLVWRDAV